MRPQGEFDLGKQVRAATEALHAAARDAEQATRRAYLEGRHALERIHPGTDDDPTENLPQQTGAPTG